MTKAMTEMTQTPVRTIARARDADNPRQRHLRHAPWKRWGNGMAKIRNSAFTADTAAPCTEPVGKTCRSCRTDRPIAAFFPSRFTADGYSERCRSCVATAAQRDRAERERRRSTFRRKTRSCARRQLPANRPAAGSVRSKLGMRLSNTATRSCKRRSRKYPTGSMAFRCRLLGASTLPTASTPLCRQCSERLASCRQSLS
jgi:hypothetical protein